jgi:membrane protein implicated in regulation of membrane protease activity
MEVFRERSFFLWLSIGAASSGILALLNVPISGQIVVFINISGILVLLERRFSERYSFKKSMDLPSPNSIAMGAGTGITIIESEKDLNIFRKSGDYWEIKYAGMSHTAKHSIGLVHIRNLIINCGEWIHCSELKRISSGNLGDAKYSAYSGMSDARLELENLRAGNPLPPENIIDRLSFEQICKFRDMLMERKEADNFSSLEERMDQLNTLDFIEKYLNTATDKNGRPRTILSQEETDRKAVSIAINRCRANLQKHPELYIHLKSFIQAEGNSFRYLPDRPIDWKTD